MNLSNADIEIIRKALDEYVDPDEETEAHIGDLNRRFCEITGHEWKNRIKGSICTNCDIWQDRRA